MDSLQIAILENGQKCCFLHVAYACALPCFNAPPLKLDGAWKQAVDCLPRILSYSLHLFQTGSSSSRAGPVLVVSAENASHIDSSRVQVGGLSAT